MRKRSGRRIPAAVSLCLAGLLTGSLLTAAGPAGAAGTEASGYRAAATAAAADARTAGVLSRAERVAKVTGPGSTSATDSRWQVKATDLGIMWDNGSGEILTAFGDTYGNGWTGPGAAVGDPATLDWRCNVLGRSNDRELADGMTLTSMPSDRNNHAKQLLSCKRQDGDEVTTIPTAGISVGKRQYMHYMSVNRWGRPGEWFTNYAGIAWSDDNGENWVRDADARWQNTGAWDNKFQMAAFVRQGGHVYMYGTPNGRFGDVHLARVPAGELLEPGAYRYWDGSAWVTDQNAAAPVAQAPVSEVSVQYSRYLGQFVMMYLDEPQGAVVMRTSPSPTGPWSAKQTVASGADFPKLYGAFVHPWSADSNSPYLYFTMSQWDPYNVYLMRVRLTGGGQFGGSPADFDGDGTDDIVTFTQNDAAEAYAATSRGDSFNTGGKWHDHFAPAGETPLTGDFTGDGKDDAVTFTHGEAADVYVGESSGTGFGTGAKWHDHFAPGRETPAVGDFDGDGTDDIVTFTHDDAADVYVSLSTGENFGPGEKWHDDFAGWGRFPAVGDVDGDGRDDLIAFTRGEEADVYVALSDGDGFGTPYKAHDFFAYGAESPRVGDVDGDGDDDIVTFVQGGTDAVYVARSDGENFGAAGKWHERFSLDGEFPYVGDYDGDGDDDIVTFTHDSSNDVYVALSDGGTAFTGSRVWHDFFGLAGETSL
ncbi:DUF4185 domain-containing protein [Streptomyces lycii]|uniref:DUF4185 domain-containing protein n=1 Tax=Streptomyces lycii TaxID=2654337 RepID=A0ABQ7FAV0_9ACTN|nr:DUF4185 domain-containing protein [Streptomyces lycii]KAF4405558.1 DUF4185 domain-containing protein [Streptomyces lycii]